MEQTTRDLVEQKRQELFESDKFAAVRNILTPTSPNTEISETLDVLLGRVNRDSIDVQKWIDSFDNEND
jgi:hypothetical protein